MVDGPRARTAVCAVRARGALDVCRGRQRGQHRCGACAARGPHEDLGTAHTGPRYPGPQAAGSGVDAEGAARARWAAAASLCRVGHGLGVPW